MVRRCLEPFSNAWLIVKTASAVFTDLPEQFRLPLTRRLSSIQLFSLGIERVTHSLANIESGGR